MVQSDKDLAGHATHVDWKQVFLSDSVFSQKLKLLKVTVSHREIQQHSQPYRSSFSMAARQSFVLLLQQNQSGLNYRRNSLVKVDKRSELDCENQPICTQVFRGITEGVCTSCT